MTDTVSASGREGLSVAEAFLAGIARRDATAIAGCLAGDARLRALTPHELREEDGVEAIASRYANWLDPLDEFELVSAEAQLVIDRIRIRYRFRGRDPKRGWQENEHTAYAEVREGRIVALNLSCAGFRPRSAPAEPAG